MTENKLLAEVNGKKIYQEDVMNLMAGMEDRQRFNNEQGFKVLTDELVNQELLLQNALEKNFDKEEEFEQRLEAVKMDMLKNYSMHKIFESVSINEDELLNYYNENQETLFNPINYQASHILVEDYDQASKIIEEINQGADFKDLAKEYSIDPSSDNGGSLGSFPKGVMVKEFQEALDDMEVGSISKPVKTQFGYHIIKLEDKKQSNNKFEDIKDQVRNTYEMVKRQEKYLEIIGEFSKDAEVKKYY